MRATRERENPKIRKNKVYFRIFGTAIPIVLLAVFTIGCTKEIPKDESVIDPLLNASIAETFPANQADAVVVNPVIEVIFTSKAGASDISSSTLLLKEGTIPVSGTVTISNATISFTPTTDLKPETYYTATLKSEKKSNKDSGEHSWSFKTGKNRQNKSLSVVSVLPLNGATEVAVDVNPSISFNQEMTPTTAKLVTISLWQGTSPVVGTLSFTGKTATFTPASVLAANMVYTGKVVFGRTSDGDDDDDNEGDDDHQSAKIFTWNFTTSGGGADVTPPTILSVVPANSTTGIALNSKATVTFNEAMNATTINSTNFTLQQGSTNVAGTVVYSGTTATFTPAVNLTANTVYTGTITTGAKDVAGNALASTYSWSFTTADASDVTAPTVLTTIPANGATSIAVNSNVTATFSEVMNSSTINATTFSLKQGTTAVAGSVTYSGTTATFNPTSDLSGGIVYTATITTGAMDAAGNAIATTKTWSFTTIAAAPVVSWATQVWPVIQSKCMPCHGSSGGSGGVNMGSYAQVSAMTNSQIDNSRMYSKMGVTAAEQAIIKAWIAAGRLNN